MKKSTKVEPAKPGRAIGSEAKFGPRLTGDKGAGVSDGAGTRSHAHLPPDTEAMAAPKVELPEDVVKIAAKVLPVPSVDDKQIGTRESWDAARDRGLGKFRS